MALEAAHNVQPEDFDRAARQCAAVELETTFLVEAGAGTGKTNVLLQRILTVIQTGRSRLERVAAITFTDKAATELRVRLRTDIDTMLAGELTDEERRHLRTARLKLERAPISTVHAFCATLLRERPLEARLDPDFTVLDAFGAQLLQTETWQEWLGRQMDTGPDVLKTALRAGLTLTHIETLRDFLLENQDCLSLLPQPQASPLPRFRLRFQQLATQLKILREACLNPQDRAYRQLLNILEKLPMGEEDRDWERLLFTKLSIPKRIGNKANWRPGSSLADVRQCLRQLNDAHNDARAIWVHNQTLGLVAWLRDYLACYATKKQERSCLDFSDLLRRTRNLLAHNVDVRRYFQHTFDFLLIDEFQDTDPLQAEIFFFLSEREPQARTWTEVTLKPGKLFLVGDPHQSIYRFRRADLIVYKQVRALIERQGEVLTLSTNFRTRGPILSWINHTFSQAFSHNTQDIIPYHPLQAGRNSEQEAEPETEGTTGQDTQESQEPSLGQGLGRQVISLPVAPVAGDVPLSREEIRRTEAQTVAAFLKRLTSPSPAGSAPTAFLASCLIAEHEIDSHDIVVLFRTHRAMDAYEDAFQAAGIPYQVLGGRQYISRQEIEDIRLLLRCVERPSDTTGLVATLRSSVFGFSDEELTQFISAGGQFSYTDICIPRNLTSTDRFMAAFSLLSDLHTRHAHGRPATLLYDIFNRTHLLPLFALRPHGTQQVANLLKLIDLARAMAAQGLQTLTAFNRLLDQYERISPEDEPVFDKPDETSVRFMTIHRAKGLEFPVVILAGSITSSSRPSRTGLIERSPDSLDAPGRLELQLGPRALAWSTQGWQNAYRRAQERDLSEERRLWYVAATRVRDHLILPFLLNSTSQSTGRLVNQADQQDENVRTTWRTGDTVFPHTQGFLPQHYTQQDLPALSGFPTEIPTGRLGTLESHGTLTAQLKQLKAEDTALHRYRNWETERQSLSRRGRRPRAIFSIADLTEQFHQIANQEDNPPPLRQRQRVSIRASQSPNLQLGRAVALALHTDNWTQSPTRGNQQQAFQEKKETHRFVQNILSSPIMHRAKAAQQYFVEFAFSLHFQSILQGTLPPNISQNEHSKTFDYLLNGAIEFAFLERMLEKHADNTVEQLAWTVVDFKTDLLAPADVHERAAGYRPCLLLQALALEKLTPYPVKDCIILFGHLPYEVGFSWNHVSRADAYALLAAPLANPPREKK